MRKKIGITQEQGLSVCLLAIMVLQTFTILGLISTQENTNLQPDSVQISQTKKMNPQSKSQKDQNISPKSTIISPSPQSPPMQQQKLVSGLDHPTFEGSTTQTNFTIKEAISINESRTDGSTQNTASPPFTRSDSYNINPPNNYIFSSGKMNLTSVQAVPDWRPIEINDSNKLTDNSNTATRVAMGFWVNESKGLQIYTFQAYIEAKQADSTWPDFAYWIANDSDITSSWGNPTDDQWGKKTIPNYSTGEGWHELTLDQPVNLTKGQYYLILEEPTKVPATPYINWYTSDDTELGQDDDGQLFFYVFSTWVLGNRDLLSKIRVTPIDFTNNNQTITYSDPKKVNMTYGGGHISSFFNIPMNETATQSFTTNTSVSFDLNYTRYYTMNNPLSYNSSSIDYIINTTSNSVIWTVNFTNKGAERAGGATYDLYNYSIFLNTTPSDWTLQDIYGNDSSQSLSTDTSSTTWLLKNTTMNLIKYDHYDYSLNITAPNYIVDIDLMNETEFLTQAYRSDSLNVTTDFHGNAGSTSGIFNITGYFIEDDSFTDIVTDITQSLDPQNQTITLIPGTFTNGSWQIISSYLSDDGLEAGIRKHDLLILTKTSIQVPRVDSPVVTGTDLNVTVRYWDESADSGVYASGVNVTVDPDWRAPYKKISSTGTAGYYSVLVDTTGASAGPYDIDIYANFTYHVNQTQTNQTLLVTATKMSVPIITYGGQVYNLSTETPAINFTDSFEVRVNYTEGDGTTPIDEATVRISSTLTGVSKVQMDDPWSNGTYRLVLDTMENVTGAYTLNLTATATNYQTQNDPARDFDIIANPTTLTAWTSGHGNNSDVTSVYYHPTQNHSFFLQWYDVNHDDYVNASSWTINSSKVTRVANTTLGGHTFEFLPNGTRDYAYNNIKITLSREGYKTITFYITFDVQYTPLVQGDTSTFNDTDLLNYSYSDKISFNISLNDTIYDELVEGATVQVNNGSSFIYQLPHVDGNYSFIFNSTNVGMFNVTITLSKTNYTSLVYHLMFNITVNPTLFQGLAPVTNTSLYPMTWDKTVAVSITWNDTEHNVLISGATVTYNGDNIGLIDNGTWTPGTYNFVIRGEYIDTYWFNFTLEKYGYVNWTYCIRVQVDQSPTTINPKWPSGSTTIWLNYTDDYTFWIQWSDTDGVRGSSSPVWINDTDNPYLNDSFVIYEIGQSDPANGNHTFTFNTGNDLLPGYYSILIILGNDTHANSSYVLHFYIDYTPTGITEYTYANNTIILIPYNDSLDFAIRWQDLNHTTVWLEDNDPEINPSDPYLSNQGIKGGQGNHTFRFSHVLGRNPSWYNYTITLNLTGDHGYKAYKYHISFLVTQNPTEINNWINKPSNSTDITFGHTYDFWVNWSDSNHSTPISGATTVNILGNGSSRVSELTHSGGLYNFRFSAVGAGIGLYEVQIQLSLTGYATATHSFNYTVIVVTTEISDSKLPDSSTIYLRYGDDYQYWIEWNDTDNDLLIEDLSPYFNDSTYVNVVGIPTNGNHTFQFNATTLGTFGINITLEMAGYQAQYFILQFIVESNPTLIDSNRYDDYSDVYLKFTDSNEFWIVWIDTNHSNQLINDTSASIEGSYTTQNLPLQDTGNHTFLFTGAPIGIYKVNITLETYGYNPIIYHIIFIVEQNPTSLQSNLTPGSQQDVAYETTFEFYILWTDDNHSSIEIPSATVSNNETTHVSSGGIFGGNYSFIFTASALGIFGVNITLNKTGYETITYQVTFIVVNAITEIDSALYNNASTILVAYDNTEDFWIIWWDLNSSDFIADTSPTRNDTTNLAFNGVDEPTGNHSFSFTHSVDRIPGVYAYTITLEITGRDPLLYHITFIVVANPTEILDWKNYPTNETITTHGLTYDFWVEWTDLNHSTPIAGASVAVTGNGSSKVTPLTHGGGTYNFRFNADELGLYTVTIDLTLPGYTGASHSFNFTVSFIFTEISDSNPQNETTIHLQYTDTYQFWVEWYDLNNSLYVNDTTPGISDGVHVNQVGSPVNGNHTFQFNATNSGSFLVTITLELPGHQPQQFIITFIVEANPTTISCLVSNETSYFMVYGDQYVIWIVWRDTNHSNGILLNNPQSIVSSSLSLTYSESISDPAEGNYSFIIDANSVEQFTATFQLIKTGYISQTWTLYCVIDPRPTKSPEATTQFPTSTTVGQSIDANYYWEDNSSFDPVSAATITIFWNSTVAEDIQVTPGLAGYYSITLDTGEVPWGYYNLTLWFWKYGHQNQSIMIFVNILGLTVELEIPEIPETLIRGEDFVLEAHLSQDQGSMLLQTGGTDLDNEPVHFSITVIFDNGTEYTFEGTIRTNNQGIAVFVLSPDETMHIESLTGIQVSYSGSGIYQGYSFTVDDANLPRVRSQTLEEEPLLDRLLEFAKENILYLVLIAVGLALLSAASGVKVRSHLGTKRKRQAVTRSLQEIRTMRTVLVSHRDGIRLYSQSIFGSDEGRDDAIAGMSAAIAAFLQEVATSSVMAGESGTAGPSEFVRMEQRGLHMLRRNGHYTAAIIISEAPLGEFSERNLRKFQKELEARFTPDLEQFFTSDQIPEEAIANMVKKYLYVGLLGAIQLNEEKLKSIEGTFTSREKKIMREVRSLRTVVPNQVVFFLDSFTSHLQNQGISVAESARFLLKTYRAEIFESLSQEELAELRKQ